MRGALVVESVAASVEFVRLYFSAVPETGPAFFGSWQFALSTCAHLDADRYSANSDRPAVPSTVAVPDRAQASRPESLPGLVVAATVSYWFSTDSRYALLFRAWFRASCSLCNWVCFPDRICILLCNCPGNSPIWRSLYWRTFSSWSVSLAAGVFELAVEKFVLPFDITRLISRVPLINELVNSEVTCCAMSGLGEL